MASPAPPSAAAETAGMCPDCVRGSVHAGTPTGVEITLGGLPFYRASPPAGTLRPPVVLFLTDVFGWRFVNSRLLCDTYAASGLLVLMPDLHKGDSLDHNLLNFMDATPATTLGSMWQGLQLFGSLPSFVPWMLRHGDGVTLPLLHASIAAARSVASSEGNGALGAVGFCWGGRYAILAAGGDAPLVDAYAVAHPSNVVLPGDIYAVQRPGMFALAESDFAFSAAAAATTKRILGGAGKPSTQFKTYAGVRHGFAVRGGPESVGPRAEAARDMSGFFLTTLARPADATVTADGAAAAAAGAFPAQANTAPADEAAAAT